MHILTSIPAEAYHSLPVPEQGQTPGGTWLLFAYLKFAENLKREHALLDASADGSVSHDAPAKIAQTDIAGKALDEEPSKPRPPVIVHPTSTPSLFARTFAQRLADKSGIGSDVHWGNEGFCVDVALRDPNNAQKVTLGVLCDASRFAAADDPMQWDIFRTGILQSQGWKLRRVWTPHFFRDPSGVTQAVINASVLERQYAVKSDA